MFTNILTVKGKVRMFLSQVKTVLVDILNVKRKIILTKAWKNQKKKKRDKNILIIANGPSFSSELAKNIIKNREYFDVLAMNNYCLNNFSEDLIPDYYLISDPENIETENIEYKKINVELNKYISNERIKYLAPYGKMWESIKKPYLQFNDSQNLSSSSIDPIKPRGYRSNTAFKAIAISLALNYSKIYILGFDYEYPRKLIVSETNKIFLKNEFSFGEEKIDLSNSFESVAHAINWWAQDYWHLRKLKSPNVFNVTSNSMIDIFPRISPENFFNEIIKIKK